MNTGKKRILSFLLAMCMTLSLLPVSAWAATETENDHGDHSGWTALNSYIGSNDTLTGGRYYLTGDLNAGTKQIKVTGTVNLCLNGYTYTSSAEGGIFLVGANGVLNIYDCKGNGGISASNIQNPVFLVSGGKCNLYGGTLQSNRSVVVIDDNDKGDYKGGTFNMYGGTVRSNATDNYQGIKINAGLTATSVNICGGTIESGRYGINAASGTVTLSGDLDITGKTADIYLNGAKIIPENLTGGEVGVDMKTPGVFTSNQGANYQQYFYSDKADHVVIKSGSELALDTVSSNPHKHYVCGDAVCADSHEVVTYTPISSLGGALGAGNYYLKHSVTATGDITISGAVNLCLNGRTLDLDGHHFIVNSGGSLTICDCGSGGTITGGQAEQGGAVLVNSGGSLTLHSGSITDNTASGGGDGSRGSNRAGGGAVCVNGGSFNMTGGSIENNTADVTEKNDGGGAVLLNSGIFDMSGGEITGNSVYGHENSTGGGVHVNSGAFTMTNGVISNNSAPNGGGVTVFKGTEGDSSSFTLSDGSITNNSATTAGGGIYVLPSTEFKLSGDASITGNTLGGSSCNVYLNTNAVITIAGQLTGGNTIGVTMENPGVFTSGWGDKMSNAAPADYFSSEDRAYLVERNSDGEAMLHQHSYTYTADGDTITESCTCGHSATASVNIPAGADLTYTGNAIEPAMVQYSTDWLGGTLTPTYKNNTNVGTAAAEITKGGATASVNFTITRAGQTPPGVGEGYTIDYTEETITVLSGYEVYTAQEDGSKIESGVKVTPGETYYIRRAETTTQEASEFTAFTVAERPATPAAPNVTGKTDTSITISTESGCEYSIDGGSWVSGSGSYTFNGLAPDTSYTIRVRVPATASTFASAPSSTIVTTKTATAEAPAAPPESAITVTDGSITVTGSVSGQEYAVLPAGQQPQEDDWQAGGGDLTFNNLDYGTQYVVWTRTEETEDAMPSQASSVSVTTAAETPGSYTDGVTVNYTDETITVKPGYEVSTDGQDWSESAAFEPGKIYYVRVQAQGGVPASASVSFTTASRPAAPGDEVIVTGESVRGKGDGSVSVPEGMEYSTGGENWVSGPATLTGLPAGTTVTVRVQATATAPHGEEQTYTVQDSDVTLTVTFDENGGSEATDITGLSYNSTITVPDITRAGYTLDGWYNGDAKWDFENGQVTANLILTAKWTLNAPTVSLSADKNNVTYSEKITLTAEATHAASVTYAYEWYKGGEKLDGKADSTLTLKTVADSGEYTIKVTASDGSQSKTVESSAVSVTITKATPDYTVPSGLTATYGDRLSSIELPNDWAWDDDSALVGNAGERSHSATFTPTDTANYNSVEQNITVQVDKATLTPSVASVQNKVYDGDMDTEGTITLTGAVLGDQPTASGVFTFVDAYAGTGKTVKVAVKLDGSWGDNYQLSTSELTATADISPKTVGLTWSGYENLVYDGEPVGVTAAATGLVSGDQCAVTVENGAQTDAGTYTAEAKSLSNDNYQLPADVEQSYTIAPRPVKLSWGESSFTYDGNEKTVAATIENLVSDDDCALTYSNNKKTEHGSYTAEVTALGNANYTLANGTGLTHSWSIGKAVVSFTVSGDSHTYDGDPKTAVVTQDAGQAQIPEDGFNVTYGGAVSQTEAGTYDITVTITNSNFCFEGGNDTMVIGELTIGEQTVEIPTADDTEFVYNGSEQTYAIAESKLYTVEGNVQKDAGTYTVTVSLNDKDNYVWSDGTTDDKTYTFIISPKTVTATWVGLEQVYGSVEPVYVILSGLAEGDEGLEAVISGVSTEAGEHPLNASLKNYDIINGTATLRIQQKPVTITVIDNAVTVGGEPAISAPGLAESDYEVVYKDKNGNEVTPSEPGTYEVWVEITNPNYRHPDGSSEKQVGSVVVSSGTPRTYEVSFAGSGAGGSTAGMSAAGGSAVILPECGFTKPGSVFTGWKYGGVVYKPGDSFTMPYADITITAQWTQARNVSGTVKDEYVVPVPGAAVSIWQGSDKLGETTTGPDGSYSFTGLAPGSYNVSASVGEKTVTSVVTVDEGGAVTGGNIILPEGNTSTRVEITPGSPDLVVGELDRVFDNTDGEDYTAADAETVKNGGMVEITFTADEKKLAEVRDELQQLQSAGDVNLSLFLDCTLEKEVYDSNGTKDESASGFISRSSVLLEVRLPLPTEMQGKYGYSVSRIHEGEAQALSTSANSLGEYFEVSADKSALILHVCCFSIYAVGYENSPVLPPLPTENAPNVSESEHGSVTVFPNLPTTGTVVTITPKPDEGYTLDKLTVTDASGKAVEVSPNGDGTYSFTQPSGAVTITVTFKVLTDVSECPRDASCPMSGYTDLNMGEWYHDGIHYCLDEGLMDGVDAGMFAPNATTSRAMIVTILWRLQGSPEVEAEETFTDVAPGDWYADAIAWAAAGGVAEGYEDGSFRPNDAITREQLAAMLWRYAGSPEAGGDLSAFADGAETSAWAQQAVSWAVSLGLINGVDSDRLDPKGQATRAQTATILMRFAQSMTR